MIQCPTPEACISKIRASIKDGAEAMGIQLCQLRREYRTEFCLKEIFDACEGLPIYVTSYRHGQSAGMSDQECAELLIQACRCGASLMDIPGDLYHPETCGLTYDAEAVRQQKELVDRIHAMGGEILISVHDLRPLSLEEIIKIAEAEQDRGTDIIKIVVRDEHISQLPAYVSVLQTLCSRCSRPVLFLPSGPCGVFLRRIGIQLGCCMALTVQSHGPLDTPQQPLILQVSAIRDNLVPQ